MRTFSSNFESAYRQMYPFYAKMNELLQPRNKVYFALVIFTVKEVIHESHKNDKNYQIQQWKLKIWIRENCFSDWIS